MQTDKQTEHTDTALIAKTWNRVVKLENALQTAIDQSRFIYGKTKLDNQNLCKLQREMESALNQ